MREIWNLFRLLFFLLAEEKGYTDDDYEALSYPQLSNLYTEAVIDRAMITWI